MRTRVILIALTIVFLWIAALLSPSAAADVMRITREDLRGMLDNPEVVVIDVRTYSEWNKADRKIKGSVWEDADEVKEWAARYPKDKIIVLYCS